MKPKTALRDASLDGAAPCQTASLDLDSRVRAALGDGDLFQTVAWPAQRKRIGTAARGVAPCWRDRISVRSRARGALYQNMVFKPATNAVTRESICSQHVSVLNVVLNGGKCIYYSVVNECASHLFKERNKSEESH